MASYKIVAVLCRLTIVLPGVNGVMRPRRPHWKTEAEADKGYESKRHQEGAHAWDYSIQPAGRWPTGKAPSAM